MDFLASMHLHALDLIADKELEPCDQAHFVYGRGHGRAQ